MSVGTPGQSRTTFDWLVVLLAVVLAGIHAYVGITSNEREFLVVAGLFAVGVLIFFTDFWRRILYLLAAMYAATLGVLWVLRGMAYPEIGLLTSVVGIVFIGLVIYRFVRESEMLT